ncbi:uncharacterized protein DUF2690 [Streptomyces sp. KhCrAH-43]|uniref:DUF2690 domain-containing protein n=2 Tax=Streptomyces TaxID=1883 RepID=UPI000382ABD4|nr:MULTISPECIES: DUF2690 domain-containing protein [unclassified Streptomyces]MYS39196.1 DUF2690 domain-containing protein [Streptomyces sp. SID4920]MYX69510.1 DUF2690 domain-containing protein [Streptomyces sp. SID8373]RAJ59446.1 uncharacterized protein DUF2690 [Streptomyces sp. KhCrAH-43]
MGTSDEFRTAVITTALRPDGPPQLSSETHVDDTDTKERNMRVTARRTLTLLATALTVALAAVPAEAAPYDPYSGSNPLTTGCQSDAVTIATRPIRSQQATYGTMEVRYSPSCGTNWVRAVITVPNATSTVTKGIRRLSSQPDGHGGWLGFYEQYETDPAVGSSFGMQVYAPGSTCVFASSVVRDASGQVIAYTGTGIPYDPWVAIC